MSNNNGAGDDNWQLYSTSREPPRIQTTKEARIILIFTFQMTLRFWVTR